MYCNRCGKEIKPEWKHCRYCGAEVSAPSKQYFGKKKKHEKPGSKAFKKRPWIIPVVCTLLLVITVGAVLKLHDRRPEENTAEEQSVISTDSTVEIDLPRLDVKTYFEERSEVVRVIYAPSSEAVQTEKQAIEEFASRGFSTYPLTTDYTMDGGFCYETPTSAESNETHPVYTTYYVSSLGEYWTIYEVNGAVMAYPISYNLQSNREAKLILSESRTVTSYDNQENKFYETLPKSSELIVKTIAHIDAESLDKLTVEAIDGM